MLKRLLHFMLRWSQLPALVRATCQRRSITIILFHNPSPQLLKRHLSQLSRWYKFVSLSEYIDACRLGDMNGLPCRSMVITLDDGHADNINLMSLFEEYRVFPTIFLCSGVVGTSRHFWFEHETGKVPVQMLKHLSNDDRLDALKAFGFDVNKEYADRHALSDEEIEVMRNKSDLQSHTISHPILPRCSDDLAMQEIGRSKTDLEKRYGLNVSAFSYPNGSYGEREIEYTRATGYECALTVEDGYNNERTDLFRLKRISVPDDADINELLVRASGLWGMLKRLASFRR